MSLTTRDRLIEAARKLFLEDGFHATSTAKILQAASANSGSLYHFFDSKEDLLVAVLERYSNNIDTLLLEPAWQGVDDPLDRIFVLLDWYRNQLMSSDYSFGCPIGLLALELHDPYPPVRQGLEANFTAWAGAVHGCLEEARVRFPANADLGGVAQFVLVVMEGAVMLARTFRSIEPFDSAVQQLRRYLVALTEGSATVGRALQK